MAGGFPLLFGFLIEAFRNDERGMIEAFRGAKNGSKVAGERGKVGCPLLAIAKGSFCVRITIISSRGGFPAP